MNMKNEETKEELLAQIEKLLAYGREEPTINPTLLAYLELSDLHAIKKRLLENAHTLSQEDKVWLTQFRKSE